MILFGRAPILLFVIIVIGVTILSIPSKSKLGQIYFDSYEYEKAYEYLSEVKATDKTNVIVLRKIKDYFILQGNIKQALEVMQSLYSHRPHNLDYIKELEVLAGWNELPELQLKYRELRANLLPEKSKEKESLLIEVAQGFRYLRNFKEANRVFKTLEGTRNKEAYDVLINYYLGTKQAQKAVIAIENYKNFFSEKASLSTVDKYNTYLYQSFSVLDKHEEAIEQALKIVGVSDYINESYPNSIENVEKKVLKRNLYFIRGIVYHYTKLGQTKNVEKLMTFLSLKFPEDNELTFELGEFYITQKEISKAEITFDKLLKKENLNRDELVDLSERFYDINQKKKSIIVMDRLLRRYPKNRSYWKRMGELYEEVGEKEKALEAFLKLLELEKKKNQSRIYRYIHNNPKLVLNSDADVINIIPRYKKLPKFNERVKEVEQRIIYLLNDIGDADKMISVISKLLDDDPYNYNLLSALGQAYYSKEELSKSEDIFFQSYQIQPKQKMVLEVLIAKDVREERYKEGSEKLKFLEDSFGGESDDYMWSMKEVLLFKLKGVESAEYKEFCSTIMRKGDEAKIEMMLLKARCYKRLGDENKSYAIKTKLLQQYPENLSLKEEMAYEELDAKNFDKAKEYIDYLILNAKKTKKYDGLLSYFNELKKEKELKSSWLIATDNYILFASGFNMTELSLDLSKGIDDFRFGLRVREDFLNQGGSKSFFFNEIYASWQLSETSLIKGSLGSSSGDKDIPISFGVNYQYVNRGHFLSIDYNHSLPALQTINLFQDEKAYERGLLAYYENRWTPLWNSTLNVEVFEANLRRDSAVVTRLMLGTDYRLREFSCFQVGALAGFSGLSRSSNQLEIGYLKESSPYYAMIKCNNQFLQNNNDIKWRYSLRVGLGGDFGRKINFLKLNQFGAELSYLLTPLNSVKLYGEHYTEALSASRGETSIIGLMAQFYLF